MATFYTLHPQNPQQRTIDSISQALRKGAVMLYPTDTVYAIGCDLNDRAAVQRVRQLKQMSNDKPLTFLCSSLSNIAEYALVTDFNYRFMRRLIPGPYTFLLPSTKLVPKLVMNPKRKTTGIRVPQHPICQQILQTLGNPVISTSAHLPDMEDLTINKAELFDRLDKLVDLIIDDEQEMQYQVSSIINLAGKEPELVRQGLGAEALENLVAPSLSV